MLCMKRITAWLAVFLLWMTCAYAVPPVLNYAGKVTVDGEAYDGDGFFKFALVNEDGTKSYWSNDGTSKVVPNHKNLSAYPYKADCILCYLAIQLFKE